MERCGIMAAETKDLAAVIGTNIRRYRDKAGLTQAQLAEKIGVGNAFISRVERGSKLMKLEKLYLTALALNTGCDALLFSENGSSHMSNIGSTEKAKSHNKNAGI